MARGSVSSKVLMNDGAVPAHDTAVVVPEDKGAGRVHPDTEDDVKPTHLTSKVADPGGETGSEQPPPVDRPTQLSAEVLPRRLRPPIHDRRVPFRFGPPDPIRMLDGTRPAAMNDFKR